MAAVGAFRGALRVSWNWTERFGRRGPKPLPFARAFGNNGVSFRLFQCFPPRNLEGSRPPNPGPAAWDRALRSPNSRPGVLTGGIEHCALPTAAPEGHIRSGPSASRFGPSDTPVSSTGQALVEVRPRIKYEAGSLHRAGLSRLRRCPGGQLPRDAPSLAPAFHSWAGCGDRNCDTGSTRSMASKFKLIKEVLKAWKHCGHTTPEKEATGAWSRN